MNAQPRPRAACLIGWPAAHSRSPLIHHYWLRTLGIEGGYVIEAVPPDDLRDFVLRLSLRGFAGANVTIPHKENVLALSTPDARAQAIGAANTLWFADGELRSTNTDVEGFINNLDASCAGLGQGRGGAGARRRRLGARRGVRPDRARHQARASRQSHAVARAGAGGEIRRGGPAGGVGAVPSELLPRANLLVNTTSLGMHGQGPLEIDVGRLPKDAVVADLVYVPLETELLKAAKASGLRTADGLGMLLHQAVRGFELWFGQRPQVTAELRAIVEADLTSA